MRLRLRQLTGDECIGAGRDGRLEIRLRATGTPGQPRQRAAITVDAGRNATRQALHPLGQRSDADRLDRCADEAQRLLSETRIRRQAQTGTELRVVAEFGVRIERQVVRVQVDVVGQQTLQALLQPAGDSPVVASPEQAVVHQHRIGFGVDGRIDQRAAGGDARHEAPHLGATLDLQTVRPIILEARRLQQRGQVRIDFGTTGHRLNLMRKTWLIFSQAVTVAVAVLFVVATLKPEWLRRHTVSGLPDMVSISEAPVVIGGGGVANSYATAAKRASPAVVSITASKTSTRNPHSGDPWFQFFFGDRESRPETQVGLGSGVIVSPEGFLLTNNHVIEGASDIDVQLTDGRSAPATVVGTDPESDVAVLKIALDRLPVMAFGNTDGLQVGDVVLAIGNPFGVGQTVTSGIVSALGRDHLGINTFENFIQTDAAINPGNSGGALVDANGNLMGINTAIYSRSGGSMGIGFAIPTSTAKLVLEGIVTDGQVKRGWIGVEPNELSPELAETFGVQADHGVIITGVLQNGPAAQAGIRPGDVIVAVASQPVNNVAELLTRVAQLQPGQAAAFSVQRQGKPLALQVTPGLRPKPTRQER